jgi:hypothetical protein
MSQQSLLSQANSPGSVVSSPDGASFENDQYSPEDFDDLGYQHTPQVQLPKPSYLTKKLATKIKGCKGIESVPPYRVRGQRLDLEKPDCRHRTLLAVNDVDCRSDTCDFGVITNASSGAIERIEFFQIFKLKNAKTKLREYLDEKETHNARR